MKVKTLIKRGTDHHVYCEDDLFTFNDGYTYVGAVFDGCSSGIKSHFASALYGKILKAYCQERYPVYHPVNIELEGKMIYQHFFRTLKNLQQSLLLDPLEILSTMILVVFREKEAYVLASGDGSIFVDGVETRIESPENAPDYLAYHLEDSMEGFISLKEFHFDVNLGLSICSDGITSFRHSDSSMDTFRVRDFLINDESLRDSEAMLARKYNILLKEGYSNYDDLSIVRFIL